MNNFDQAAVHSIDALADAIDPWLAHMTWRRDYATWRERRLYQERYQAERIAQIEQFVGSIRGLRILDLGAGMGGFAVASALHGAHVFVSEFNMPYCEIIQLRADRYQLSLPIVNAAGENLPFADAQFDAVVCWDVLEHVQHPTQVLREIHRVLKPRGHVLLTAINRRAWIDPHYHIPSINWWPRALAEWYIARRGRSKENARFNDMQRLSTMHYFDYPEFVALAKQTGYTTVDMNEVALQSGHFVSKRSSRQRIRALLRALGLEYVAYKVQRAWYVGMFELALTKDS